MNKEKLDYFYKIARFVLIIFAVVALGLVIINSAIDYRYKVVFIKSPCHLCAELHPNQSQCVDGCFQHRTNIYPDGSGGWKYDNGTSYKGVGVPSFNINLSAFEVKKE